MKFEVRQTTERATNALRYAVLHHPQRSHEAVTVLQQKWQIQEFGNSEAFGLPMNIIYEWRNVPTVTV